MFLHNPGRGLVFLFVLSLLLLGFLVAYLWVSDRGPFVFSPYSATEPTFQFSVQLEEANVSKIGEQGKEWEFHATSIEQKDHSIYLEDVSGVVFRDGAPLYRLEAGKGTVSLSDGTATLWKVELKEQNSGTVLRGEKLSFLDQEKKLVLYQVSMERSGMKARCGKMVYNVVQRKMVWEEDVEIRIP